MRQPPGPPDFGDDGPDRIAWEYNGLLWSRSRFELADFDWKHPGRRAILMVNPRDWRCSFFYPGCGTDLEPLARFSHLCDSFVYVDWNVGLDNVVASFRAGLRGGRQDSRLELLDDGLDRSPTDLLGGGPLLGDAAIPVSFPAGFRLTTEETSSYDRRLGQVLAPVRPWAREFTFLRTVGSVVRELKLTYIAAEGLAAYCALYASRGIAPQFLCTIQSGPGFGFGWTRLEEPGGTFERLLLACAPRPRVWVRGGRMLGVEGGRWPVRIQAHKGWSARAYVREGNAPFGSPDPVDIRGEGRTVTLDPRPIGAKDLADFDAAFLPPRLLARWGLPACDNAVAWPDSAASLGECLERIDKVSRDRGFRRVVMVPQGREDEGVLLREWARRGGLPDRLGVHFAGDLDFADLRSGSRRPELEVAYCATAFRVDAPGSSFELRVGRTSEPLDRMLAGEGKSSWAYVTACNPGSEALPEAENAERMSQLQAEVRSAGHPFYPGEGKALHGGWPPEPSLLLLGIDADAARQLAARFDQEAILVGRRGEPARLRWTHPPDILAD